MARPKQYQNKRYRLVAFIDEKNHKVLRRNAVGKSITQMVQEAIELYIVQKGLK